MLTLKKTTFTAWFVILVVFLVPLLLWAYSSNPPQSRTGAPGESTCASCHSGGLGGGRVAISSASGSTYTPGVKHRLIVTITDANASAWGYEMTAVQGASTSTGAGTFAAADANSSVRTSGTKSYAAQTNALAGTTGSASYAVDWTPPATSVGNVTVYAAGLGADNSGDTWGDSTYTTNLSLTPSSSGTSLTLSASTLAFFVSDRRKHAGNPERLRGQQRHGAELHGRNVGRVADRDSDHRHDSGHAEHRCEPVGLGGRNLQRYRDGHGFGRDQQSTEPRHHVERHCRDPEPGPESFGAHIRFSDRRQYSCDTERFGGQQRHSTELHSGEFSPLADGLPGERDDPGHAECRHQSRGTGYRYIHGNGDGYGAWRL
jgi:hypothetical protein